MVLRSVVLPAAGAAPTMVRIPGTTPPMSLSREGEAAYMSHGLTPVHFLDIGLELIGFDVE